MSILTHNALAKNISISLSPSTALSSLLSKVHKVRHGTVSNLLLQYCTTYRSRIDARIVALSKAYQTRDLTLCLYAFNSLGYTNNEAIALLAEMSGGGAR